MTSTLLVWNPNPTLDVVSEIESVELGAVHRSESQTFSAGGKGTLLVRALKLLGSDCLGIAPIAGPSGSLVAELLAAEDLPFELSRVSGATRAAVTLVDRHNASDTVVNGPGPTADDPKWHNHLAAVEARMSTGDFGMFVVAGRPPLSAAATDVSELCAAAATTGLPTVLDVSSPVLEACLAAEPWLVKINRAEAHACVGAGERAVPSRVLVERLISLGALQVILTDGAGPVVGDFLNTRFAAQPPTVSLRSAVGCGDCFLAGLLHGLALGRDSPDVALRWAMGVAGAAAETLTPGYFSTRRADVLRSQCEFQAG